MDIIPSEKDPNYRFFKYCRTFKELAKYIKEKPMIIQKYSSIIIDKMNELLIGNTTVPYDSDLIVAIVEKLQRNDHERTAILQAYASKFVNFNLSLVSNNKTELETMIEGGNILVTLLLFYTNAPYPKSIFATMIRIYLEIYGVTQYPSIIANAISENITFEYAINMSEDQIPEFVLTKLVKDNKYEFSSDDIQTMIGALTAIIGNAKRQELVLDNDFCLSILYRSTMQYGMNVIHALYYKYFRDDLDIIVSEVSYTISTHNYDTMRYLARLLMHKYNLSLAFIKCLFRDVSKYRYTRHYKSINHRQMNVLVSDEYWNRVLNEKDIDYVATQEISYKPIYLIVDNDDTIDKVITTEKSNFDREYPDETEASEGFKRSSRVLSNAQSKIYNSYRSYKDKEAEIDSQITKTVKAMGKVAVGDTRTEVIEGKSWTALGLLKKLLGTVAIFSLGPIKAAIALLVRYSIKKNTTMAERRKIIYELNSEIRIIDEKIEDAKCDGNRKAKYAMMRTRSELIKARDRIQAGLGNDDHGINLAKAAVQNARGEV